MNDYECILCLVSIDFKLNKIAASSPLPFSTVLLRKTVSLCSLMKVESSEGKLQNIKQQAQTDHNYFHLPP